MTKAHLIAYFVLAVIGLAIGGYTSWRIEYNRLHRKVFADLDSAYEGGYFEPGEQLHGADASDIAVDLVAYGDDYDSPHRLIPHVRAWMLQKGLLS
jgi:hypothetical protein